MNTFGVYLAAITQHDAHLLGFILVDQLINNLIRLQGFLNNALNITVLDIMIEDVVRQDLQDYALSVNPDVRYAHGLHFFQEVFLMQGIKKEGIKIACYILYTERGILD